jgi:hypothetical protein
MRARHKGKIMDNYEHRPMWRRPVEATRTPAGDSPATKTQMNLLIWIVLAAIVIGGGWYIHTEDQRAMDTGNYSACWSSECKASTLSAISRRLRTT